MLTTISIILVFGALIFFHELGHLIIAKRSGILCREFAIGFGPKIFSFTKNETLYTLRLLPLGGYVRMAGEDPEVIEVKPGHDVGLIFDEDGKVSKIILNHKKNYPESKLINVRKIDLIHDLIIEGYSSREDEDMEEEICKFPIHPQAMLVYDRQEVQVAPYNRQFGSKTLGQRAATIFAGPLANFILAFAILFGFSLYSGSPVNIIADVIPGMVAEQAGLQTGDRVISIDQQPIKSWQDLAEKISVSPHQELSFVIERDGQQLAVPITPAGQENRMAEGQVQGYIGVTPDLERSFLGAMEYGFDMTVEFSLLIFKSLGMLITGGVALDELAGPVGIIDYTGQMAQAGLPVLLRWTSLISINLAIFNLLPIPALDGGRLMFLAIEAVRGRPIDPQKEGMVHFVGFALLMLLIVVVTWNDIQRVFLNN